MTLRHVSIQAADFDVGAEIAALQQGRHEVGAVASFVGCVRGGPTEQGVTALELEHYPGMTERAIDALVDEAHRRFRLLGVRIVHRIGRLAPGERIVLVAVASIHRRDAFEGCEFLMDVLKTQAPFWKRETTPEGGRWVDARVTDDEALARWGVVPDDADSPGEGPRPGDPGRQPP